MRALKMLLLCMACATSSYGQQVEFAGQINTGLARFGGESANKNTAMSSYTFNHSWSQTYNPYGKKFTPSYGASVQVQRVTRSNFLVGTQAGVESLRSRINISEIYIFSSMYSSYIDHQDASGKTTLRNDFINLHPFLGYRVSTGAADLDFSFGPDIGIGLSSREKGKATAQDESAHIVNRDRGAPETDIRARVGMTAYHKHYGLSASYTHGVTNYLRGYDGGNPKLYARVLRLGFLYRL